MHDLSICRHSRNQKRSNVVVPTPPRETLWRCGNARTVGKMTHRYQSPLCWRRRQSSWSGSGVAKRFVLISRKSNSSYWTVEVEGVADKVAFPKAAERRITFWTKRNSQCPLTGSNCRPSPVYSSVLDYETDALPTELKGRRRLVEIMCMRWDYEPLEKVYKIGNWSMIQPVDTVRMDTKQCRYSSLRFLVSRQQ